MSIKQFPGGIITKNPTAPTTSSAKGIWTLDQAQNYTKQGIWPRSPGAPTIGTVTTSGLTAIVPFSTPTDLGTGSITYTATSSPGGFTGTGTSPISVSGLSGGTSYTFTVTGTTPGGTGPASAASNSVTPQVVGQQSYTGAGTNSWVAPAGVTSVSAVAVATGARGYAYRLSGCGCLYIQAGGTGGALSYKNSISVTPGSSYSVVIGATGTATGASFVSTGVLRAAPTGCGLTGNVGDGGGYGGPSNGFRSSGGGGTAVGGSGAGGYSGNGGNGGTSSGATAGSGGGGGGGNTTGGGGVGILGSGSSGCAGGVGGSGGGNASGSTGGTYGGGGGSGPASGCSSPVFTTPGAGAVRIIWPGTTRSFPSTCTGDL